MGQTPYELQRWDASDTMKTSSTMNDPAFLRLALEMAEVYTWEVDLKSLDMTYSPNASAILETPLPANLHDAYLLLHPDDRDAVAELFDRTIHADQAFDAQEYRLVHPDTGDTIWVQSRGAVLHSDNGARFLGVTQDITERKQAEGEWARRLQEAESERRRLVEVFEQTPSLMAVLRGPDHVFEQANPLVYRWWGQTDLIGKPVREALPSLHGQGVFEMLDRVYQTGEPVVATGARIERQVHPGQPLEDRSIDFVCQALRDVDGEITGVIGQAVDVTARAHTETVLRTSEERYRTLFESMDEGFCVIKVLFDESGDAVDYRFLEANPAFEQQTGLHQAMGKTIRELVPGLEAHWFDKYGKVALTGESIRFVDEAKPMEGRWFDVNAFRIGDPQQRLVALLFTDITQARQADERLRESEERLRRAIEIETVGVIFFRADGAVTFANDAFLRMSGYTVDDVENGLVRWDTMTPPEWMPRSNQAVDEFLALGRTTPYEKEYFRKNGSRWWGLFTATRVDDEEGVEFIIDISERKRAEAERERLAAVVESSRDAVFGHDLDGSITDWNPAASELFGYTAAEIVGREVTTLVTDDHKEQILGILARVECGEDIPPFGAALVRKDGNRVDVELRPSTVRDAGGRIVGAAAIARDATERKRLERAQEDFLAMASHDLRSPVTVVRGRAQLMHRRKAYDESAVDIILEQVRRIERLVADLQELVKLEAGGIELERMSVDARDLVHDAVERSRGQTTNHRVHVDIPPDPVIGNWDRDRLGQVLDNLIGNAAKYSPEGGEIIVRVEVGNSDVRLCVSDQGEGIPVETLPHLFDRFYRAEYTGPEKGLGIGLYISRVLVEAHGGRIWAESSAHQGSTFTVELPAES